MDILWSQGTHSGTGKQEQTTFKGKVICKTLQDPVSDPITDSNHFDHQTISGQVISIPL